MKQSVTEIEAKGKWCRHGNVSAGRTKTTSVNRTNGSGATTCLASDCMDWEWLDSCPQFPQFSKKSLKDGERMGRCGAEL